MCVTDGGMIGLTGGLGTFGKEIFQFNIGLVIGAQFNANEHSSSSVNVVSLIILSTESLFLFIVYYFIYVLSICFQNILTWNKAVICSQTDKSSILSS